jgi:hypothetical protein
VASATSEIDDIRRKMAQIRRELHDDVRGVVEGAEAATDWRRYVQAYPWAILGATAIVGYLLVPARRTAAPLPAATEPARPPVEATSTVAPEKSKGWVRAAFGLVAPLAIRAAQGYALQYFEQWLTQQMAGQDPQILQGLAAGLGAKPGAKPGPEPGPRESGMPRF